MPDHELLRCIGRGSYGEVWLARNVLGEFRAVKVIYRQAFEHDRPYEREFEGIRKFEPISRAHPSQLNILHVGRNDTEGCFYYVMELADDGGEMKKEEGRMKNETGAAAAEPVSSFSIRPSYLPKTLRLDLHRRGLLPVDECITIGLALTTALEHLHAHGLVHRDIKPSNIIFVKGTPKLADIGLVASTDATMSFVGTSGFLPPEGPGTFQADIYSLGKVLYEMCTGRDRQEFPKLPPELIEGGDTREPPGGAGCPSPPPDGAMKTSRPTLSRRFKGAKRTKSPERSLLELNAVILKACHSDPRQRYASAQEMAAELALLQRGQSVKRRRRIQRRWAVLTKLSLVVGLVALIAIGGFLLSAVSGGRSGSPGNQSSLAERQPADNPEVAMLVKLGHINYLALTEEGFAKAMECFNQALELDPKSIAVYAAIADLCVCSQPSQFLPPQAAQAKMRWARDKLLAIDSRRAEGHVVQGIISLAYDWNPDAAERELKLALALDPEFLLVHIWRGRHLLYTGKFEEAEREFKKAQQLDPTRYGLRVHVALPSFFARRYDRAIEYLEKASDVPLGRGWAQQMIGRAHEEKGDYAAAIEVFEKFELGQGGKQEDVKQKYDELRAAYAKSGPDGYWRKKLEFAQREYGGWNAWNDALDIAQICAHLGAADLAFEWLDKAFQVKSEYLLWLNVDPGWDNIRSDPRFIGLLKRMGLEK